MNSWQDAECASDAGSEDSEESISVGCVRDRILRNVLMKSQAIESENRTLRKKLALYAYEFKRLRENAMPVTAVDSEQARPDGVSDLKSVVVGHSTELDDVSNRLKEVMIEFRIDEDVSLAGHTMVDPEADLKCSGQSYGEPAGCRLKAFEGGKGRGRDRRGLLRAVHRLRAELAATKEQLKAVTSDPWGVDEDGLAGGHRGFLTSIRSALGANDTASPQEVVSQIAGLKAEGARCREELEATQLRVASLEAEVHRVRETGLRWRRGLEEVAAQVHKMHPLAQRVNGLDVDKQLAKLQSELTGAKALLHRTTVHRSLEETRGRMRNPSRCEERCRQTGGGSIGTRRNSTQARSLESGNSRGGVELASERHERYGSRHLTPSRASIES